MNSKVIFGQYYNSNSWLHRLDPRTKIVSIMVLMVAIFLIDNLYMLLGLLGGVTLVIISSMIPFGKFLRSLKMVAFLLIFAFACQILFRKGETPPLHTFNFDLTIVNLGLIVILFTLFIVWCKLVKKMKLIMFLVILFLSFALQIYINESMIDFDKLIVSYKIDIYKESLESSLFILVRIVSLIFMSSLLTLSTKPTDLNNGLEHLLAPLKIFKVNPAIISMMVSIALRNIPTLINEATKVLKAQASRGVDFNEAKLKEKISQIVSLIVPMFIISYQKAADLSDAMEARGYDPNSKRTSINVLKMKISDYISLAFVLVILTGIIVYNIMY